MDLKAISCRIEWSLFQVHSTKHVRVIQLVSSCKYGMNTGPVGIRIYRAFFLCLMYRDNNVQKYRDITTHYVSY